MKMIINPERNKFMYGSLSQNLDHHFIMKPGLYRATPAAQSSPDRGFIFPTCPALLV
jgi:hypothetical protein